MLVANERMIRKVIKYKMRSSRAEGTFAKKTKKKLSS